MSDTADRRSALAMQALIGLLGDMSQTCRVEHRLAGEDPEPTRVDMSSEEFRQRVIAELVRMSFLYADAHLRILGAQ